jgi:hypothetical protein
MNDPRRGTTLDHALRSIAEEDARLCASPAVEANVMAAFHEVARARHRRRRRIVAALSVAAVVVAMAVGGFEVRRLNSGEPSLQTSDVKLQTSSEVATAFLPLAYSGVPIADGHVVRLEVPRASLISFGLVPADDVGSESASSGTVLADVIVGDDGLARAVRFVRRPLRKETRQ